jgi:hypothetical protein
LQASLDKIVASIDMSEVKKAEATLAAAKNKITHRAIEILWSIVEEGGLVSETDPEKDFFDEERVINSTENPPTPITEEISTYLEFLLDEALEEYSYVITTLNVETNIFFTPTRPNDLTLVEDILHFNATRKKWSMGRMGLTDSLSLDHITYFYYGAYMHDSLEALIDASELAVEEAKEYAFLTTPGYIEAKEELEKAND